MHAPMARNPFAAAPVAQSPGPVQVSCPSVGAVASPTGPMLGKASELQRIWAMPVHMGHSGGINCLAIVDDRIYSGGRDNQLFVWRLAQSPGGGMELVQDAPPLDLCSPVTSMYYDQASKWLFCGLWNGDVMAYCKNPVQEVRLAGHRRSVNSITVHSSVVISGSHDGQIRLWTRSSPTGGFACHGKPLDNPTGAITSVRVLGDGLWVAAQNGISSFDLATLQPRGMIPALSQVTGLAECQGYMIATFRSGDLKIYDTVGNETFNFPARGEHRSNTAVELMMHPIANKPMILCGQQFGYVTAYDIPDFRPRGSFVCDQGSDVKAILDLKHQGMFLTAGFHGDIILWQWGGPGAAPTVASPFAAVPGSAGAVQAPSPFAAGGGAGGAFGAAAPCGLGGADSMMS